MLFQFMIGSALHMTLVHSASEGIVGATPQGVPVTSPTTLSPHAQNLLNQYRDGDIDDIKFNRALYTWENTPANAHEAAEIRAILAREKQELVDKQNGEVGTFYQKWGNTCKLIGWKPKNECEETDPDDELVSEAGSKKIKSPNKFNKRVFAFVVSNDKNEGGKGENYLKLSYGEYDLKTRKEDYRGIMTVTSYRMIKGDKAGELAKKAPSSGKKDMEDMRTCYEICGKLMWSKKHGNAKEGKIIRMLIWVSKLSLQLGGDFYSAEGFDTWMETLAPSVPTLKIVKPKKKGQTQESRRLMARLL